MKVGEQVIKAENVKKIFVAIIPFTGHSESSNALKYRPQFSRTVVDFLHFLITNHKACQRP